MTLHHPFIISARLMPAVKVGEATISLQYYGVSKDRRTIYQWFIDMDNGDEYSGADLHSGCGGGNLEEGFASLLSFLGAASDDDEMFHPKINEWSRQFNDEIAMLRLEIEESGKELIEE